MGIGDKIKNKADQASGKVKETLGRVTGNERLEAEGDLQHAKGKIGEGTEKLKDGVTDAAENIKDAFKK